jgi:hypothetical protein
MIESFEAENLRCFESLRLTDLRRVNIITGENASGKTALLEALYAASRANSEGLMIINQNRGLQIGTGAQLPGLPPILSPIQFSALWEPFFFTSRLDGGKTNTRSKAQLRFVDGLGRTFSVELAFERLGESIIQPTPILGVAGAPPLRILRRVGEQGKPELQTSGIISLGPQGQLLSSAALPNLGPTTFIFPAALIYGEADNVTWFSQLREREETGDVISFFKKNFPFISNLEVLAPEGIPGIYVTLKSGGVRRLQLVSAGVYKIISILLGCARSEGGIVLIDEIENGIFYEKYALTWCILNKFSKDYQCQIFVTSHSRECLEHLPNIIGDDVESLITMEIQPRRFKRCNSI